MTDATQMDFLGIVDLGAPEVSADIRISIEARQRRIADMIAEAQAVVADAEAIKAEIAAQREACKALFIRKAVIIGTLLISTAAIVAWFIPQF